jgi:hypothetical protein
VKSVFKYRADNGLIEKAVPYGGEFQKSDKSVFRRHRAQNGEKMLEVVELRRILDALAGKQVETGRTDDESGKPETVTLEPNPALRAMILLGINAGFGNADCGQLPLSAIVLDRGWVDFPRPKTGIPRRCPLWPETVTAIRLGKARLGCRRGCRFDVRPATMPSRTRFVEIDHDFLGA